MGTYKVCPICGIEVERGSFADKINRCLYCDAELEVK